MLAASDCRTMLAVLGWLFAASIATSPVSAQTYLFYGTPSEAFKAQMATDLSSALQNAVALRQSLKANNYSMMADRKTIEQACSAGYHDTKTEAELLDALMGKDVYYLALYSQQGGPFGDRSRWTRLEALGGAPLDGGIRGSAEFAFSRWAATVNAIVGQAFSGNADKLRNAIAASADLYADYVVERNQAEINDLRQNITYKTPPQIHDPSPQVLADAYISIVLDPAIGRLKDTSPDKLSSWHAWLEDVRSAIIAYEKSPLDPQAIAARVRQDNPTAPDVADAFLRNATAHSKDGVANQAGIETAYDDAWIAGNYRRGVRVDTPPGRSAQLGRLKYVSDPASYLRLQSLQSREMLAQLNLNPVDMFFGRREDIIDKIKASSGETDDDWCTGQPLATQSH